jgi:hypothetical protein
MTFMIVIVLSTFDIDGNTISNNNNKDNDGIIVEGSGAFIVVTSTYA